jgi:hypothetical protein
LNTILQQLNESVSATAQKWISRRHKSEQRLRA